MNMGFLLCCLIGWRLYAYVKASIQYFAIWKLHQLYQMPRICQRQASKLLLSPQITNPQFLGLILLSQIRKFLRWAGQQNANPQIFTKYCKTLSQNSPKYRLFKTIFYFVLCIGAFTPNFCKEKMYVLFAALRKF
jgi:hypothetical protein